MQQVNSNGTPKKILSDGGLYFENDTDKFVRMKGTVDWNILFWK